ncbi:S-adenosyl-L-methionine-dependent methyltransferase [Exidia glandulosa HHB12029]|uniref:S-adenosyl-L-methionine-dependent methyltransferase n=1 Tax=Exidia glandulosa HHB12029 TaxID=1314781 RepID=A0A165ZD31_EXIGL|nr:S-adenosyl-L-methionine-dependent methyltransferase [Exidia glandulosa HHB12029]
MTMPRGNELLVALKNKLGAADAANELRWMRQYAKQKRIPVRPLVERRVAHEPLQYILGTQPFGKLDIVVRKPVLIPRPETEDWTMRLAKRRRPGPDYPRLNVLDLCTGTGCIPILLARTWRRGGMRALAIDIGDEAVMLAQRNAITCKVAKVVQVVQADIFSPDIADLVRERLLDGVDVLTANPPYVSSAEYETLDSSVRDFEDARALLADDNGLAFYPRIAELATTLLNPGGIVAVEVGKGQSDAVVDIFRALPGVMSTEVWNDPWGIPRAIVSFFR